MRAQFPQKFLLLLAVLIGVLCSCGKQGNAQDGAVKDPPAAEKKANKNSPKLERISVSEMGKLRSRVGKEAIVFGQSVRNIEVW